MKTIKALCGLLVTGAMMTGCSNEDNVESTNTPKGGKTYYLSVNASKGSDDNSTRALALDDKTLKATWATTEHVYVQGTLLADNSKFWFNGTIRPQYPGTSTLLSGAISLPDIYEISIDDAIGDPHILDLQFPRSGELDYTGQVGTLADIAAKYDYAIANGVRFDIEDDHIEGVGEADFINQQAIVKFTLIDKADETVKLSPTALTVEYGENSVSLTNIPATTYTTNGDGVLFVAIPGFESQAVKLTAVAGGNIYTYSKESVTFVNGKYYEIKVKMKSLN